MNLYLNRKWFSALSAMGELYEDDTQLCYTLEPPKPIIPQGNYGLVLHESAKLGYHVPMLEEVVGHDHVYLHKGNLPKETTGCILVGMERGKDVLSSSKVAFDDLMHRFLLSWLNMEPICLIVKNESC